MKYFFASLFLLIASCRLSGQNADMGWQPLPPAAFGFIHNDNNVIVQGKYFDSFYSKLLNLKHGRSGRVSIVHIGDSHIQADGITGVLRRNFQTYFGDAGRGLVFPYQLANSNAPLDIQANSNVAWKSNRLTNPERKVRTGISGYGIHSTGRNATFRLRLKEMDGKQDHFNSMLFFFCDDSVCYQLTDSSLTRPILFSTSDNPRKAGYSLQTDSMLTGFEICRRDAPDECDYSFYGVSLEKRDTPGVLYHSIGVNGARFDQYSQDKDFFRQLAALNGDLYVISLGTNEAQNPYINEANLVAAADSFVHLIRKFAPHAPIVITTPPPSYFKGKKPNKSVETVSRILRQYCAANGIGCWDIFSISSGLQGAADWKKHGLMNTDLVHFNTAGYQLQGSLLSAAFAKGYNQYEATHHWTPPIKINKSADTTKRNVVKAVKQPPQAPKRNAGAKTDSTAVGKVTTTPLPPMPAPHKSNIKVEYSDQ